MCGPKCRGVYQTNGHTVEECAFLAQNDSSKNLQTSSSLNVIKNLYELIFIVRVLLMKKHNPDKYEIIMKMESHLEMRKENKDLWKHYEKNVVERLRNEWKGTDFSEFEIHKICGIVDVNCFEIGQMGAKARGLFPIAFLLAHDCRPNTSHTDDPETYAIIVRTSTVITKGEAITISYAYTLQVS